MADRKVTSIPDIFGGADHYDENGNHIGYSVPGIFGGMNHYNADGSSAGYSTPNLIAGSTFRGDGSEDHFGMFSGGGDDPWGGSDDPDGFDF